MTSAYVANIRASGSELLSDLLLSLRGFSYRLDHGYIESGVGSFVFSGGHRNKVAPANTSPLFADMMQEKIARDWAHLLPKSQPVGYLIPCTDSSVAIPVDSSLPDPTRSRMAAIFRNVMRSLADRRVSGVVAAQILQRLTLYLSSLGTAVRGKGNWKAAATSTSRIAHWVASFTEVACRGRDLSSRPHLRGAA